MQQAIKKILFFSLFGIFQFSFAVNLNASETDNVSFLTNQVSGEHLIKTVSSEKDNHQTATTVTFQSRWEVYELLFGTLMAIIGLIAVSLALYRWNAKDLSLISFGVFCFIYGARTRAIQHLVDAPIIFWAYWPWLLTYLVPATAYIFLEQFFGKGWKSTIRRIWQIQIVFGIVAASVDLLLRSPGAAMVANNVMATVGILVVGINVF